MAHKIWSVMFTFTLFFMHCCTIFVAWAKFHTFTEKSTSLALNTLRTSPRSETLTRETQAQKPGSVIQTIPGDFKLFTLDYISQHRGSTCAGNVLNTHWNVFLRNCVTGSRGSRGHMYTFRASCSCAPALISSMPLGTRQKANPGRLDRTVQSDTDCASDRRAGVWYTFTEWTTFPWRLCAAFNIFSQHLADVRGVYAVLGRSFRGSYDFIVKKNRSVRKTEVHLVSGCCIGDSVINLHDFTGAQHDDSSRYKQHR